MSDPVTPACPHREATEALARDALPAERRPSVQRHLEQCETCRSAFRQLTADHFPRLQSYTVVARIGGGAYGQVYKAVHHAKQRTEALKVLHSEMRFQAASFENEARLVARLRHPNIATLYDAHLGTPPFYYTMEFVEGRQLNDHFRSAEVSVADRIEIFRQVALAMGYAHGQGVVHRDLKPQNILIDTAGQPRIVDFGIARKLALEQGEGGVAAEPRHHPEGTEGYMAPEEEAGGSVDGRADIYALGVLLYQGVTGEPLSPDVRHDNMTAILRRRRISRAGDLAAIIARCLRAEPAERYATCAALADDLGRFLASERVRARARPGLGYRAARWAAAKARAHPYVVRMALIAVVAALLAGMFGRGSTRWLATGTDTPGVVLVAFRPSTMDAIRTGRIGADLAGLTLQNRKSWRVLYGRIMEQLARAAPHAVVWDYYFPDCHPEYDAAFLRGFDALRAKGVPAVVGCRDFDVNGVPLGCGPLIAAAEAYGALHAANPNTASHEYLVPICIQRGLAPPIPGLATAAFAASRFPDCELDLRVEEQRVLACYRRKHYAKGEPAWRTRVDEFPIALREPDRLAGLLRPDDEVLYTRVRVDAPSGRACRIIPFEDVLKASGDELQALVGGRVVVAGEMLPQRDIFATLRGPEVHGCEVQARALSAFLAHGQQRGISEWGPAWRVILWCVLGGIVAHLVPVGPPSALRFMSILCAGLCVVGVTIGLICAGWSSLRWPVEAAMGTGVILVAGSLTYWCRAVHVKQAWIAPGPIWPSPYDPERAPSVDGNG